MSDEKKVPTGRERIREPEPYTPTRRCADCDGLAVFDGRDEYFTCSCPCNRVVDDKEPIPDDWFQHGSDYYR